MDALYPDTHEIDFHKKILEKEEYYSTKYPDNYYETVTLEDKCNASSFNVENHQIFLSRFMSTETPYKSLLLFHGVGTGKTCAALIIAEGYKKAITNLRKRLQIKRGTSNFTYYNYPGVYVISSKAIHKVFRNELYNTNKVPREEAPGMLHCLGNEYFPMNDDAEGSNQKLQVSRKILSYYNFFGPSEFSNFVRDIKKVTTLKDFFSHSVFIVDEVHNVLSEENELKDTKNNTLETLKQVFKEADDTRLVMLSATPMRDDEESIMNILTLLRYNDGKYAEIEKEKLFPKGSIDHAYLKELSRGYVSYLRGNNPVSFPGMIMPSNVYKPDPERKINGEPYIKDERMYDLFKCVMSSFQYDAYSKIQQDFGLSQIKLREAATIVFPSGEIGDQGFDRNFNVEKGVYTAKENFLKENELQNYSVKIYELLKLARTNTGLHYIYSLFDKSGALVIALAFEANGYALYSSKGRFDKNGIFVGGRKLLNYMPRVYRCSVCGNLKTEEHRDHDFKQGTFVLFTGTETAGVQDALQVYNSLENKDGHLIKFFIGTLVSAEGVDYKRIKHLHVINPWYNFTRTWQAIGRGLRNCSQADFPEGDRNVVVYLYSATSSEGYLETIDEQMYRLSLEKDIRIKDVEHTLKTVSVDCYLNKEANMYASDKDYSRECDYKECDYTCSFEPTQKIITNKETFHVKNDDPEIRKAINLLFLLFKKNSFYSLEEILKELRSKVDEEYIFVALTFYVMNKLVLKDKYSRRGFMVYKNGYYYYQPNEFDDTDAPIRFKETPLMLKTNTVNVIAPPKVKKQISISMKKKEEKEKEVEQEGDQDQEEQEQEGQEKEILFDILSETYLENMTYEFDKYPETMIIKLTKLLLKKNKDFKEEKVLMLLKYLRQTGFVLAEKYDPSKHPEDMYWKHQEDVYVGYRGGYWNKNIETINVLTANGSMTVLSSMAKIMGLLKNNEVQQKRLASNSGCFLHGIISYDQQRQFRIIHNINKPMESSDARLQSTGRISMTLSVTALQDHLKCLKPDITTLPSKKDKLAKEIELELRRKEQANIENLLWLERRKK